ncbi:hypothetical protein STEG23_025662, partial [Scotinomys teguina]
YYEPFTAYFLPGGDRDFFVKPTTGELPPFYTKGIPIVVGFKPRMYSKKYQATLVVKTDEIYCLYEINGLPPLPKSMVHVKAKVDATNKTCGSIPPIQHNFIRENIKLQCTASMFGKDSMIDPKNLLGPVDTEFKAFPEFLQNDSQEEQASPEQRECSDEEPKEHIIDEVPVASSVKITVYW